MGYVPCLAIDGVPYVESVAIIEMLDELYPDPALYPKDARSRARVRALVEIVNSGIQPLQNRNVTLFLSEDTAVQRRWLQHFVGRGMAALEAAMAGNENETCDGAPVRGPYAYGDRPSAADVFLVPQVVSAHRFQVDLNACPRVTRAFEVAMKLDAFQKAAPENQPDAVKK
jgi:maleylpyruvate isomerase